MEQRKQRWFKFFYIYREAFEEISFWEAKKFILAIIDYHDQGFLTQKLSKKSMEIFKSLTMFIDAERELSRQNGAKGAQKRWNPPKKQRNMDGVRQKNRVSITEK